MPPLLARSAAHDTGLGDARSGVLVLALSAFAAVSTEMLPVGLLPAISRAFGVAESTTGLLVSLYALMVAALSIPLTLVTARVPGKRLLVGALACYAASNLLSALAPDFAVYAVARALGGITHALFFSVCIGYAARLVPPQRMGRALALTSTGVTVGFVLGVPLATALGEAAGWRAAFVALLAVAVVALILVVVVLPDVRIEPHPTPPGSGHRGRFAMVIVSNTSVYLGHYSLYTYVTVMLLRSGVASVGVGPVLLLFGAFGLVALSITGHRLDRWTRRIALLSVFVMAAATAAIGAVFPTLALVIVAGTIWNGAFGPVTSVYQTLAVRARATSPELAGAWINATCNVGIAGGAAIGGVVLDHAGIRDVAWLAAALILGGALTALVSRGAFADDQTGSSAVAATNWD